MSSLITSMHARLVLRNEDGNALADYMATALVIVAGLVALFSVVHGGVFNSPFEGIVTAAIGKASSLIASNGN